jgi:hypothetical protein
LFSNTYSICSSLNVRDQVWHPYRQNYNLVYKPEAFVIHFSDVKQSKLEHRVFRTARFCVPFFDWKQTGELVWSM